MGGFGFGSCLGFFFKKTCFKTKKAVCAAHLKHALDFDFQVMFTMSSQQIGMESSFPKEIVLEIVKIFGRDGKE